MRHFPFTSAVALAIVTVPLAIAHAEEPTPGAAAQPTPPAAAPAPVPATETGPNGTGTVGTGKADADKSAAAVATEDSDKEQKKSPWRGSILLFDQSVTTPTVGLGRDFQSANNTYEWWFALKPRYVVYEDKRTTFSVNGWTNLYLELTNSDSTTTSQEPVIGSTILTAPLSYKVINSGEYKTSVSLGPRLTLPTDQASRDSGLIVGMGASTGLSQAIPLAGKSARAFNSMSLGVSGSFSHPLNRATTAVNSNLNQLRQDAAGRTFPSDLLRSSMNVKNSVNVFATAGLQITPKLGFGLTYVWMNSWVYAPRDVPICVQLTGCVEPLRVNDPQTYRVGTWALASLDYDATDELSVSLGYYNQTNQIGPDGSRRSPFWSPDARIFFTLTGNLDVIYDRIFAKPSPTQTAAVKP